MSNEAIETKFAAIVESVKQTLKPLGYVKQGAKFRRLYGPNVALIQFQRSRYNDTSAVKFTINISVVSARLVHEMYGLEDLKKASEWHGQLRLRIGFFLPVPADKWWVVDLQNDPVPISEEIESLLTNSVVPYLEEHASDQALLEMWLSGRSPGLTDFQSKKYIDLLTKPA